MSRPRERFSEYAKSVSPAGGLPYSDPVHGMEATGPGAGGSMAHASVTTIGRRGFLKLLGPGITILFTVRGMPAAGQTGFARRQYPDDFNAYLRIAKDGSVACYTGKIEMGQGIVASLGQMLAEELEVPYESVRMVMGDTKLCPWDAGTNGSRTIKYFGPALRAAAAEAREVLIELAAEHLGLPADRLVASGGAVCDRMRPERKVAYGTLARGETIERHLREKPGLRRPGDFKVCGKSPRRPDALAKVTGAAEFAGDIRVPGMLYGRVLRPPAHGARLVRVDTAAAGAVPGARVFVDGDFVGVVHPLPDVAERALALVEARYELGTESVDEETIHDRILQTPARDNTVEDRGDLGQGWSLCSRRFEATYRTPYVAHAAMETHSALADVRASGATVWAGTQRPFGADAEIGRAIGMQTRDVRVITPFVGGGFGGKSQVGQAVQAARLSKLAGAPVQVVWTREEEFFYDTFQPAAVVRIRSGLDRDNRIAAWDYHVFFAGDRSSQNIYDVPHVRTISRGTGFGGGGPHPFGTGAWRGPGSNTNIFARESHIDLMAAAAGIDPLQFRLRNLSDARMRRVVEAAAGKFRWQAGRGSGGRGRGMVCLDYLGTYVAAMAEVRVDPASGALGVERIVHAQDMGPVINPEGARVQIEGAITMGLGYCLGEQVRFEGGRIKDLNFSAYRIPRFSWMPQRIETVLVENHGIDPSGCGEPPIVGMGALIANAVFDATGIRFHRLPITPEDLRKALAGIPGRPQPGPV